jgi:hypothetical protein
MFINIDSRISFSYCFAHSRTPSSQDGCHTPPVSKACRPRGLALGVGPSYWARASSCSTNTDARARSRRALSQQASPRTTATRIPSTCPLRTRSLARWMRRHRHCIWSRLISRHHSARFCLGQCRSWLPGRPHLQRSRGRFQRGMYMWWRHRHWTRGARMISICIPTRVGNFE